VRRGSNTRRVAAMLHSFLLGGVITPGKPSCWAICVTSVRDADYLGNSAAFAVGSTLANVGLYGVTNASASHQQLWPSTLYLPERSLRRIERSN